MLNTNRYFSIPEELNQYYKECNVVNSLKQKLRIYVPNITVSRNNATGIIDAISFCNNEGALIRDIRYSSEKIVKITNFNLGFDVAETYCDGYVVSKAFLDKCNQTCSFINYGYDSYKRITSVIEKKGNIEIKAEYSYDDLDRIIRRHVFCNSNLLFTQNFIYDVLNRIIQYSDDDCKVIINSYNQCNGLVYYTLLDNADNKINIENSYTILGYANSRISINGHNTNLKDLYYVDNIALKTPTASVEDLEIAFTDWVLGNAFGTQNFKEKSVSNKLIKESITSLNVLPISMRKLVLYKQTVNA